MGRLTRLIYEQEVIPRRFEIDDITSRDLLHAANVGRLRPLISLGVMSLHQNKRVCIFLEEGSPETPLTSRNTRWLVHERPASSACLMINFSRSLLIFRFGPSVMAILTPLLKSLRRYRNESRTTASRLGSNSFRFSDFAKLRTPFPPQINLLFAILDL